MRHEKKEPTKQCKTCLEHKMYRAFFRNRIRPSNVCGTCRSKMKKKRRKLYSRKYMRERLAKDPLFRLLCNLRSRTRIAFLGHCKNQTTLDLLGCTLDKAKHFVELKFLPDMSWDNYGQWELDHIIPLGIAPSSVELEKLCHYTNLQPMWKSDHVKKTAKDVKNIKQVKSTTYASNMRARAILP